MRSGFKKARLCDGPDLYRGTTEQDEQQGYALPAENHAAASAKAGRNAAKAGIRDPAPGRSKKELEFLNAMLSDRLALAQKKRFGASSEKYAEGYIQLGLFNEAEQEANPNAPEPDLEEVHPSPYKRKKRSGKKEEDLSSFETTEVIEYKLTGEGRYCPDCNTKYKVVTKETVKRLKFVPARFEVVEEVTYVYSCPKCGAMKRPEKTPSLLKGSIATPSLAAGIMNAKYVNGMPLARQERKFARYVNIPLT